MNRNKAERIAELFDYLIICNQNRLAEIPLMAQGKVNTLGFQNDKIREIKTELADIFESINLNYQE